MPADNSIYIANASGWWDENNFLYMLKSGINPARFGYFHPILSLLGVPPTRMRVLDAGCGGGILSEEFAGLGCRVHGLDISSTSLATALKHSRLSHFEISYLEASAQSLPFDSCCFDLVVCCDALEHFSNPGAAIAEAARVLRRGGLYFFDTINRTLQSYLENILVAQLLPQTRFFPPNTHDWRQFIRPAELEAFLKTNQLTPAGMTGLRPGILPNETAREIRRLKHGEINYAEFGRRLQFQTGGSLDSNYIGYARKEC